MKSEKVKEIKKALENCTSEIPCYKCKHYGKCEKLLTKENILTLINEMESENENLSAIVKAHKYCVTPKHCLEVKALKDRIAELEKGKTCVWEEWTDGDHSIWCCSNCKEDFCFIEGDVYENNYGYCPHCGAKITALKEIQEEEIDETLKEFIDE